MPTYVALLRAVNVGGRGRLAMADLRALMSAAGYGQVATYLQSGNVVFTAETGDPDAVAADLTRRLADEQGLDTTVVVCTGADIAAIAADHPFLEEQDDHSKLFVMFLDAEPDPVRARQLTVPPGAPEQLQVSGRRLYMHYPDGAGRSRVTTAYLEKQLGVRLTGRNWRTVTALAGLAADRR